MDTITPGIEEPAEEDTNNEPADDDPAEAPQMDVSIDADDFGDADLFDDIEDTGMASGGGGGPVEAVDDKNAIADAINQGSARLAVAGLDEDERTDLETEFEEIFEAFRLGHFGNQFVEEYLFVENEDVDPIWGFAGSAVCCLAICLWMRPDGEQQLARLKTAVGGD